MEGTLATILWHLLLGAGTLLAGSLLPGLALTRLLDPTADLWRKVMLAPSLGLLALYGVAGWMVVALGIYDTTLLLVLLAIINLIATAILWERDIIRVRHLTPWERLELADDQGREVSDGEMRVRLESDVAREAAAQRALQERRPGWLPIAIGLAIGLCLLPLLLFEVPLGLDWIGFATLSHTLASTGELTLPPVSSGRWTYPPAFPALAALLETATGLSSADAVQLLGQWSLLWVILGLAGAADRWGAAAETLLGLGLAAALFAKAYDSGYPTVASQLGLVLGLLVLVRPAEERRRYHDVAFALSIISVAVIHPTGSLYLGTLLAAHLAVHRLARVGGAVHMARIIVLSLALLAVAVATVLLVFAPRLLERPVTAEYGWQGGLPLLIYHGPVLLILGVWSAWRFRTSLEGWLITGWLGGQWLLSFVHLLDGVSLHPLLTLMSYTLYSMALHGFHVPLAVLVGLLLARQPRLTPREREQVRNAELEALLAEETEELREAELVADGDGATELEVERGPIEVLGVAEPAPRWVLRSVMALVLVQLLLVQAALVLVAQHPELEALSAGDRRLAQNIELPEGSLVYNEVAPWGHLLGAPWALPRTAFPGLGLLEIDESVKAEANRAIAADDVVALRELGVSHAVTSPLGGLGWRLARSPWWALALDDEGSRLWALREVPFVGRTSSFLVPEADACGRGCTWRPDIWDGFGHGHTNDWPDERPLVTDGSVAWVAPMPVEISQVPTRVYLMLAGPSGLDVTLELRFGAEVVTRSWVTSGGWEQFELRVERPYGPTLDVDVTVEGGGALWLNPLAVSGRDDVLFDRSGAYVHWVEVRPVG